MASSMSRAGGRGFGRHGMAARTLAAVATALLCGCDADATLGESELRRACLQAQSVPFDREGAARIAVPVAELTSHELPAAATATPESLELRAASSAAGELRF